MNRGLISCSNCLQSKAKIQSCADLLTHISSLHPSLFLSNLYIPLTFSLFCNICVCFVSMCLCSSVCGQGQDVAVIISQPAGLLMGRIRIKHGSNGCHGNCIRSAPERREGETGGDVECEVKNKRGREQQWGG